MAYTDYDPDLPDPTTQTLGQAMTSDRNNLLAMRDMILAGVGTFAGWDAEAQDSDGTTPPTTPSQADQIVWSSGTERVKLALTYTDGLVTAMTVSYSADSGSNYDVIKGGTTNGICALTYDTDGNWLSTAWS
jgi:hypothetical protein